MKNTIIDPLILRRERMLFLGLKVCFEFNKPITYHEKPHTLNYEERFDGFKCRKENEETVGKYYLINGQQV